MSELKICRICLVKDVRMFDIAGTQYQALLEKNFERKIILQNNSPLLSCHICYHQLKKFSLFLQRAFESEELLHSLVGVNELTSCKGDSSELQRNLVHNLVVSPISFIAIPNEANEPSVRVKQETQVKEERNNADTTLQNEYVQQDIGIEQDSWTDPEDDIPLKNIVVVKKQKTSRVRKKHRQSEKGDKKRVGTSGFKEDFAKVVMLTKEEQLLELKERAQSISYVNAALKCTRCCKGFVDSTAFENHRRRHLEISGPYECEICGLRYLSPRQLTAHTVASHCRRYQCLRCPHTSHTANQAREHEKWHRGYMYDCKLCGQKFKKPTSYLSHLRACHPHAHACRLCGASFVSEHGLHMHTAKTHWPGHVKETDEPVSERSCKECDIEFASTLAWKRHVLTFVKHVTDMKDSTKCIICSMELSSKLALSRHMRGHERELWPSKTALAAPRALNCQHCGRLFVTNSKLQMHIKRTHLGVKYNKEIVCEICSKKCTSNAALVYHQRTHTGEKPYECITCRKCFADNHQLKIHNRTHTGERPYCCGVCGKRFTQKPSLNRHNRVHTGAKPYSCQFCAKSFSQSNSLKLHTKTVHLKSLPNISKNKIQNTTEVIVGNDKET